MLGAPNETRYDLRFRFLDIPVRIHPLFWLVTLMLSGQLSGDSEDLGGALVWVACVFVSILVHELGHGLSSRVQGHEPMGIVLYSMGGVCMVPLELQTPLQRIVVLLFGPGAGFLLLAFLLGLTGAIYHVNPIDALALTGLIPGDAVEAFHRLPRIVYLRMAFYDLVWINFFWGLVNLLPIWPLDGGRVAEVVLGKVNPRAATRRTHVVSLLAAALMAFVGVKFHDYFLAVWFGLFALVNYQMYQAQYNSYWTSGDDWWRS